jgi:hypothetical protein
VNENPTALLPGLREEADCLGQVMFSLPFDIPADLCLVQADGRREISGAPDAVLFQIYFSDEFKLVA